jgi:DNA repair photolyase
VTAKWPDAKIILVDRHNDIEELKTADPQEWLSVKREVLVLGIIRSLNQTPNGRSTDFIAPSSANGCLSACQYCYVGRRKSTAVAGSNPLTVFLNIGGIIGSIKNHAKTLGHKTPNQCDPLLWTYDIGCNNDVSLDLHITDNALQMIRAFDDTNVKLSFATKTVNLPPLLSVKPNGHTRIRFSLMPENIRKRVDIRTSSIEERLEAMNVLADHGYEIHANFSPVIVYDGWEADWVALWQLMDKRLSPLVKQQLKCEIIFLTHSKDLHEINMSWNPNGEQLLWRPELMAPKLDKPDVLSYRYDLKRSYLDSFTSSLNKHLSYCKIRYAF